MIDFREKIETMPGHSEYLILPLPLFNRQEIGVVINFARQVYNTSVPTDILDEYLNYRVDELNRKSIDGIEVYLLYFKLFDYTANIAHDNITVRVNENQVEKLIEFLKNFHMIDFYITYRIKDIMTKDSYMYFLKRFMKEKDVTNLHIINPYR